MEHAIKVLSYVRPLRCSIHPLRAHMVFVDRIQIAYTGSKPCGQKLVLPTPFL